jgi:hypothetical protein
MVSHSMSVIPECGEGGGRGGGTVDVVEHDIYYIYYNLLSQLTCDNNVFNCKF